MVEFWLDVLEGAKSLLTVLLVLGTIIGAIYLYVIIITSVPNWLGITLVIIPLVLGLIGFLAILGRDRRRWRSRW